MRQVLQHLRTGMIEVAELPTPNVRPGCLLIQTSRTLISAGSERTIVEFSRAGWLGKARSQPEKVQQVLDKIRTDGVVPTLEAVFSKLDEPMTLGYCNVGRVIAVGAGAQDFAVGDRVASNGQHAEVVCVPKNLCAKIPDGVSDEQAAFTVISSIALQGIRLIQPTFGEQVVVVGLGLIGLIAVQLLRAHGCEVLGVDLNPARLALAREMGARVVEPGADPLVAARTWTAGRGVDAVLITASARTDEIMHESAQMSRQRGRIVLVGVVGLNLRRDDFYAKELTFQVSCSYGPGRYDEKYEQAGLDYPVGYVRWTEQRNFEAVLAALRGGQLRVDRLVTHRYEITQASRAYDEVADNAAALGVLLDYPLASEHSPRLQFSGSAPHAHAAPATPARHDGPERHPAAHGAQNGQTPGAGGVFGVVGAGAFTKLMMMPALLKAGARVAMVADINASAAHHVARKFHAAEAVTDAGLVFADPHLDAVLIAVGHHLHARFVCMALDSGKHAFVEKPLAMNVDELRQIFEAAARRPDRQVMVGFNRRFSPHIQKLRTLIAGRSEPLAMSMTINAGFIPPEHWTQDPVRGGGRIIGEACHFIDLLAFLAGAPVRTVSAAMAGEGPVTRTDKMSIVLSFADGSVGAVNYFANGSKQYPKERLEVFSEGRVLLMDNFRKLIGYGVRGFRSLATLRQDKGHAAEFAAFVESVRSGSGPLIPMSELVNATLASFAAMTSAHEHRTIDLVEEYASLFAPPPPDASNKRSSGASLASA